MIIYLDLDGTIAKYERGHFHTQEDWDEARVPIGESLPYISDDIKRWLTQGHTIKICTARVSDGNIEKKVKQVQDWCEEHYNFRPEVTNRKHYEMDYLLDDRAKQMIPNTGLLLQDLTNDLIEIIEDCQHKGRLDEEWYAHIIRFYNGENDELKKSIQDI